MVKNLLLVVSLLVIATIFFVNYQDDKNKESISSFEECVEAGYPIAESYPEQCFVPDGPSFTKNY